MQRSISAAPARFALWLPTAITFFVSGAIYGTWATQVPLAKARLGVTKAEFGLLLLAMGLGAVTAMVASGRLIPRYGAARLIMIGFGVFLLSSFGLSIANTSSIFFGVMLLYGASGGMMDVAMNAHAAYIEGRIGRPVMSSIHGMWSIGGLIGSASGSYLLSILSGPGQALTLSIGALLLFLTIASRLSSGNVPRPEARGRIGRAGGIVWVVGVLTGICFCAEGSVRDWGSLYLNGDLAAPLSMAGWGFAALSAFMAAGRFGGDWLRSRLGDRRLVIACGGIAFLGFSLAAVTTDYPIAIAGFGLVGFGLSNVVPVLISVAGRLANPAASIAVVVTMGYAGYLVSPPILGAIAGWTSIATLFAVVGALSLLVAVTWALISSRMPK